MARHLVLFDIDGTLLDSRKGGRRAMRRALQAVYGTSGALDTYPMAGKTDTTIVRDMLLAARVPEEVLWARFPEYRRVFAHFLEEELQRRPPRALPGARELVTLIHRRPDMILGLLTGNIEEGARLKLRHAGFDPEMFVVAAYGSDALTRDELPSIALTRAETLTGERFSDHRIVVVGDTPLDIRCGHEVGAKTIAVATGPYSPETLASFGPDVLLPGLKNPEYVLALIEDGEDGEDGASGKEY